MRKILPVVVVLALLAAVPLAAQAQERWLHVRVDGTGKKAEKVRVNIPLSVAEKILPAITIDDRIHEGKVRVNHGHLKDVDVRAILEAVRGARDGEFVTVETEDQNVRVAKSGGYLLVEVRGKETVDVKVPMTVVEALLSGERNELNVLAAVRALNQHGETVLVEVKEKNETVRVWVDARNTQD